MYITWLLGTSGSGIYLQDLNVPIYVTVFSFCHSVLYIEHVYKNSKTFNIHIVIMGSSYYSNRGLGYIQHIYRNEIYA